MTQQINLYEARLRPRHELVNARNVSGAAIVLLLLVSLVAAAAHVEAMRTSALAERAQKDLAEAQQSVSALATKKGEGGVPPALAAQLDVARATLAARREIVALLDAGRLGNTAGFSSLFAGFARQAKSELWITGLSITAGGEEIEIRGRALDASILPAYVQALGREPVFRGRRFSDLEMRSVDAQAKSREASAATGTVASDEAKPPVVRVAEFVLRSENAVGEDAARAEVRR